MNCNCFCNVRRTRKKCMSITTTLFVLCGLILVHITLCSVFTSKSMFDKSFDYESNEKTSPKICCSILTAPKYLQTRAIAVQNTWAPRCDVHYFITENDNQTRLSTNLPLAPLSDLIAGYDHLTQKSVRALLFAYEHYTNTCQWFVKADDDTYLIVDHLRAFLRQKNPAEPITFGYNFKNLIPQGYHSGGAGYVLSTEALKRFYQGHRHFDPNCTGDGGAEDLEVAKCLRSRGVYSGQSLDQFGREMFHPLSFDDHFQGNFPEWLSTYAENPLKMNYNCCSDQSISFHYVTAEQQYLIDFFLYRIRHR